MQMTTVDLGPAAAELARVVAGVRDDHLCDPTPSEGRSVAALLDHLVGLTLAFRMAAEKTPAEGGPSASASDLAADWRTRIPAQLDALVAAWRSPSASEGTAIAGGVEMPAPVMSIVALNELVVHGWELAVATGQPYAPDDASVQACSTLASSVGDSPEERAGLYGPRVPVPDDASAFDRLLGLTGRDPGWRP